MQGIELTLENPVILALVVLVGAAIGSLLTLITYRLPLDKPVANTRSACTHCGHILHIRDLVPILSYLFHQGKCRHCEGRISMRYPLTEIACAFGAFLIVVSFGFTLEALAITGLWWCIVAIILTDLEHYIILDEVQIACAIFGAIYAHATGHDWSDVLTAAVAGAGAGLALKYGFLYFSGRDGLGMGDVKFLGVAGIWLADAVNFVPFLFFSGVLGILSGMVWRALGHGERFPFGPSLAVALLICVACPVAADGFWRLYGFLP